MTTICTIYLKIFFKTIVTGVMITRKTFSVLTTYNLPLSTTSPSPPQSKTLNNSYSPFPK